MTDETAQKPIVFVCDGCLKSVDSRKPLRGWTYRRITTPVRQPWKPKPTHLCAEGARCPKCKGGDYMWEPGMPVDR